MGNDVADVQRAVDGLMQDVKTHLRFVDKTLDSFEQEGHFALDGSIIVQIVSDSNSSKYGQIVLMGTEGDEGEVDDTPFYRAKPSEFSASAAIEAYENWANKVTGS